MAWRGGTLRRVTGSAGSEPMPAGPLQTSGEAASAARPIASVKTSDPDSELARLQGATLGDEWAEKRVPAPQSDAIEVSDDDTVRLPQRHLGIWHAFGRAIGGDEGLHLA